MTKVVIKTLILMFLHLSLGVLFSVQAQRPGNASNGGSLGKEVLVERNNLPLVSDLVKYRLVIKNLNLNEDVLIAQLDELNEKKAKIKLRDLILAYLIFQKDPIETVKFIDNFIAIYQVDKDFFQSFFSFLNLDKTTSSNRKSKAEQTLKNSLKRK